jgi:geranylgeranyl diphosphate synthase type I
MNIIQTLAQRYSKPLDQQMRQVFEDSLNDETGFGVMMRYAMGWVDAEDQPYDRMTGKRLRPYLLLMCYEASGGEDIQEALPAASAVEILHNFSLIHDDIQDVSYMRHNRPTVWRVWGEANAINAGDAMFTLAYTAMEHTSQHAAAERTVQLWRIFNQTNLELTRGQHLDMRFEKQESVAIESYISMIRGKSAALLAASAQMGALLAGADEERAQHFADFGMNIGIAFQVHDDVLGIWGDPEVTGKSAATDIISRKKSLPVLYGLSHSESLKQLYAKADFGDMDVQSAIEILNSLGAEDYTKQQETHYQDIAMRALDKAQPDGEAGQWLRTFIDFLFERDY